LRIENDEYNNYIEHGDTAAMYRRCMHRLYNGGTLRPHGIPYRRGVPRLYNGMHGGDRILSEL
jgi:hypothetical protein